MKKLHSILALIAFLAIYILPAAANAKGDWNNSDTTRFSFRIMQPYTGERFLKDECVRLVIEPWGTLENPRAFVCLTHTGVDYADIRTTKKKVFNDAYFYEQDNIYLRADLDITNVVPGKYKLWVELKDEASGERALGSMDISIIGKATDTGWLLAGDRNYYYLRGGEAVRNTWLQIKTRWFAFDNAGLMCRTWNKIEGKWYFFDDTGGLVYGWQEYLGKRYFLGAMGEMVTGWQEIEGSLYYFAKTGEVLVGEQVIDEKNYVFDDTGKMVSGDSNVEIVPLGQPTISMEPIIEY